MAVIQSREGARDIDVKVVFRVITPSSIVLNIPGDILMDLVEWFWCLSLIVD